ncbi:MAG: tRNA (adenosine(37)-N6)-dimethylallyltransferase MiaA [Candidatus Saganbacteria bacterium]|nr:tRNA (adenosine(37)-N6)-dimethylallyltransferase MiaA [Candidatus Saganbacteria bacterium]
MNKTLVILGPTAVGKSALAVKLAQELNGEIISADSMQVYRGMDIGTAKPSKEEQQGILHHLIDIKAPDEPWTVSDFVEQAHELIPEIASQGKKAIVAGGTGLYLWTLINGFSFPIAPADKEVRKKLEKLPAPALYFQLSTIDPIAAQKIHANDKKRIIRALEVFELTGKCISEFQQRRRKETGSSSADYLLIGLNLEREKLYERIEQRIDQMIARGLINEVKGLLSKGFSKDLPSFQALGYKEVVEFLEGRWNKEQMIEELKKRTRNFARRQITWFKRVKNVKWFEPPIDAAAVLGYINSI